MWHQTNRELFKEFVFKDFKEAFSFMEEVAKISEEQNHHPRWLNEYNTVKIWLSTHDAGDTVTDKDHKLAQAIDSISYPSKTTEVVAKNTSVNHEIKLFADGGSRGNPGPSASGYVLLDMDDNVIFEGGVFLGVTTNNQAEYQALKFALEEAQKLQARTVHVYMDSLLVVNQLTGKFKVRNRDLWPIHDAIRQLAKTFKDVHYTQVPREFNKLADAMVNKTLDERTA
jgi:ribonuclease HI/pterin-4a-carbinolamine dehydratase